ncbi:unnamed protein product [Nesidiocoris tenuis]|uniref:Flagellin C-terminal domain-containing protein n=1 Tax=Nesidiocoris tenuis TaxID=355587 RepID=A0A6H5FUT6_9HEMI|nr:unnamed protein product [Nesidiocoris tenuis]
MKDLATQGADDTNGASDRDALQSELTELNKELANILNNTRYGNEKLFSSAVSVKKPEKEVLPEVPKVTEVPEVPKTPEVSKDVPPPGEPQTFRVKAFERVLTDDKPYFIFKLFDDDGSLIDIRINPVDEDYIDVFNYYAVNVNMVKGDLPPPSISLKYKRLHTSSAESDSPVTLESAPSESFTSTKPALRATEPSSIPLEGGGTASESDSSIKFEPGSGSASESDTPSESILTQGKLTKALQFQIGAGKDEVMKLDLSNQINDVTQAIGELSGAGHDLTTGTSANSMIGRISDVLNSVGAIRSSLGASINRLGHTSNNLANMKDNTDNSIGVIRDTDYASESSQMTRQQMLAQSSQLMQRQAGSMSNMILNFLK